MAIEAWAGKWLEHFGLIFKDFAGGADAVDIAAGNTSLEYVLGARDVATLQDGGQGLIMQGANLIIKKVAIQ